jgi:anti-anti-sigma factor
MLSQPGQAFPVHPGPQVRVELAGDVDLSVRNALGETLSQVSALEPTDITVDLEAVSYLASEGLAFLVGLNNLVQGSGHRVTLQRPCPIVARVLHITGFDAIFMVESTAA